MNPITRLTLGPLDTNCYYLTDGTTAVLIDPAVKDETLDAFLKSAPLAPSAILLTHGHFDHISGVVPLVRERSLPIYIGENDRICLSNTRWSMALLLPGFRQEKATGEEDVRPLAGGEPVTVGTLTFRTMALPGHSRGGIGYLWEEEKALFCGDTVFCGGFGRTDGPGGDLDGLADSIGKIALLPPETALYPGHGGFSTVGEEAAANPFFKVRP